MTIAEMVEATIWSWGVDSVLGRPLAALVAAVMASPAVLVDPLDLEDVQRRHAGQLAHALSAGLARETVGGREWFMPGECPERRGRHA